MKTLKELYSELSKASGIEVGDTVLVFCKIPSLHFGWENSWEDEMDECIGREFIVKDISHDKGVRFYDNPFRFPIYSLKLIRKKENNIDYSGNYIHCSGKFDNPNIDYVYFDGLCSTMVFKNGLSRIEVEWTKEMVIHFIKNGYWVKTSVQKELTMKELNKIMLKKCGYEVKIKG